MDGGDRRNDGGDGKSDWRHVDVRVSSAREKYGSRTPLRIWQMGEVGVLIWISKSWGYADLAAIAWELWSRRGGEDPFVVHGRWGAFDVDMSLRVWWGGDLR